MEQAIAGCWMLDTGYWMLDTGYWILDAGYWMLDTGCWMLDARCWILIPGSLLRLRSAERFPILDTVSSLKFKV